MGRRKSQCQYNPYSVVLRRSPRFKKQMDLFQNLSDDLIFSILNRIPDFKTSNPATLIRHSLVSKRFASIISTKTLTLSLRVQLSEEEESHLCLKPSHCHIPKSAIPAMFKVFRNLEHLKICLCESPPTDATNSVDVHRMKAVFEPSSTAFSVQFCSAVLAMYGLLEKVPSNLWRVIKRKLWVHTTPYSDYCCRMCQSLLKSMVACRPASLQWVMMVTSNGHNLRGRLSGKEVFRLDEKLDPDGQLTKLAYFFWVGNLDKRQRTIAQVFLLNKLNSDSLYGSWRGEDVTKSDVEKLFEDVIDGEYEVEELLDDI